MLDYYGSIVKSEKEIDRELIQKFKDRCHEAYMKKIISDLRKENFLHKEYSHSGWMIFHCKPIHDIIKIQLNYELQKANKRIKLLYCYNKLFDELNICRMICDII